MKMKMKMNILILIILSYGCFSFVLMEFNLINWSENVRFLFILSPIIYLLIGGVLLVFLELKENKK